MPSTNRVTLDSSASTDAAFTERDRTRVTAVRERMLMYLKKCVFIALSLFEWVGIRAEYPGTRQLFQGLDNITTSTYYRSKGKPLTNSKDS